MKFRCDRVSCRSPRPGLVEHLEADRRPRASYDTLMRRRGDLAALTLPSAGLDEGVAGIRLHGTGQAIRAAPDGRRASTAAPITLDEEEIGAVRLERPGPLDEVLLDRLAIAAAAVVERYGPARTTMTDPALVELVISADGGDLGFAAGLPVRVAAVRSQLPLGQVGRSDLPGPPGQSGAARRRGRPGHRHRPGSRHVVRASPARVGPVRSVPRVCSTWSRRRATVQVEELGGLPQGAGGAVGVQRLQIFRASGQAGDRGHVRVVSHGVLGISARSASPPRSS